MADPSPGIFGLDKIVDWTVGAVVAVGGGIGWFWSYLHRRFDQQHDEFMELIAKLDTKADQSELDRARDNVEKIFDRLDNQGQSLARIETKLDMIPKRKTDREV